MHKAAFIVDLLFCSFFFISIGFAQKQSIGDTSSKTFGEKLMKPTIEENSYKTKAAPSKAHIPRIATLRSLVLPGWGQAYNREYWKIPLVYGALAIPVIVFQFNNDYYNKTKFAYQAVFLATYNNDSSKLSQISSDVRRSDGSYLSLLSYEDARNFYRRNRDFSVLYFFLVWGLNVADATVYGHLKNFDVSPDLSLHIDPTFKATTQGGIAGLSLILGYKTPQHRLSMMAR